MSLIEEIKKHPAHAKLALLIRHADREAIPAGEFGNEILINEKGKQNAFEFGRKLKEFQVNKIFSSPIPRCIQTAEFIVEGYGAKLEIVSTKCLGDPGLHVADEKLAGEFYLQYGFDEMYQRFIRVETIPGIPDKEAYKQLMSDFIKVNSKENGLTIFVTHDSLIAFYHYCLNKKVYTKENWVKYLDGLILTNELKEK